MLCANPFVPVFFETQQPCDVEAQPPVVPPVLVGRPDGVQRFAESDSDRRPAIAAYGIRILDSSMVVITNRGMGVPVAFI